MARERELRVQIVGDASKAQRAFGDVERAGDGLSGKFKGWGAAAAGMFAGAAVGAGAFAVSLVDAGAKLVQVEAKAARVFGGSFGKVEKWAKESANNLGLTSGEAIGLAAGLGDLLVPMGFAREQAAQMSTDVIQLSGALSAWSGGQRSATEVAEILTGAMLGEYDALKGLGINLGAADVQARKAADGTDKHTGAEGKRADALAVVAELMRQTTDAQQAFIDNQGTLADQITDSQVKWDQFIENLQKWTVETAVPFLGDWAAELKEFSNKYLDPLWDSFYDVMQNLGGAIYDFLAGAGRAWNAWFQGMSTFGAKLFDWVIAPVQRALNWLRQMFDLMGKLPGGWGETGRQASAALSALPAVGAPAPAPTRNLTGGIAGALSGAAINVQVNTTGVVGMTINDVAGAVKTNLEAGLKTAALVGP